jgi:hypothetical protein
MSETELNTALDILDRFITEASVKALTVTFADGNSESYTVPEPAIKKLTAASIVLMKYSTQKGA